MNELQKELKQHQAKILISQKLSDLIGFDNNFNAFVVCEENYDLMQQYIHQAISDTDYSIDFLLVTYVCNFLSSLMSYLARKKKFINDKIQKEYKNDFIVILQKYWSPKHQCNTSIDKLIALRNTIDHENIFCGYKVITTFMDNKIVRDILVNDIDIAHESEYAMQQIKRMNEEIAQHVKELLNGLNIRESILFVNAHSRKFNSSINSYEMYPPATQEEIEKYNKIIIDLKNKVN